MNLKKCILKMIAYVLKKNNTIEFIIFVVQIYYLHNLCSLNNSLDVTPHLIG